MAHETPTSETFNPDGFSAELGEFFKVWESNWQVTDTPTGSTVRGPFRILDIARPYMTPEQLAAEQPEQDAYSALVNHSAEVISLARNTGQHPAAVDSLVQFVETQMGSGSHVPHSDAERFIGDVFKSTLDQLAASPPDPSIQ